MSQRSVLWAVVNWAEVHKKVQSKVFLMPDQASIEEAITSIESAYTEAELFLKEATDLEFLLVEKLLKILRKSHSKEIKRRKAKKEREHKVHQMKKREMEKAKVGIQFMGPNGPADLKDMGLDPEMMDMIQKGIKEQLFGKKKKKDDDADEDEDPGASFYL
ncbi:hypothetical protein ES708_19045 [subsurface metagenome]